MQNSSEQYSNGLRLRILILTADVGRGHRSASIAIAEALRQGYRDLCEPIEANPVNEPSVPAVVRNGQKDHTRLVRSFPKVYSLTLRVTDSGPARNLSAAAGSLMLNDGVATVIERYQPAAVIATHPILLPPLANHARANQSYQTATIITDLTRMHKLWFNKHIDLTFVPTSEAAELGRSLGLSSKQLQVTGIPVHPDLSQIIQDKTSLRKSLGLEPDRFTVLAVGGRRVSRLHTYLRLLNRSRLPVQVIAIAGEDDELYRKLGEIDWQVPAMVCGYVENLSQLQQAADCVVSKAGGLVVAESLATGLPFLVTQCIPDHEQGNADYVVGAGAGDYVKQPSQLVSTLTQWLDKDGQTYALRAANARRIGRPAAARDVADALWQLAGQRKTDPQSNGHTIGAD